MLGSGDGASASPATLRRVASTSVAAHARCLTTLPLAALIFYEVSGGPFGIEDAVGAGGPALAIAGFCLLPFVWSVPEALVTAELATAFPEDAGFVAWVTAAFGPAAGFQEGFWSWVSGVADNAIYPVLFASYVEAAAPGALAGWRKPVLTSCLALAGSLVNYAGVDVVGRAAVGATAFVVAPFLVLVAMAVPRVQTANWTLHKPWGEVQWGAFANVMFWNLNYWDSVSTLAGEVAAPGRTLPRALAIAVVAVVAMYILPLAAGVGVLPRADGDWSLGYFAAVGKKVGGPWLAWWIVAAAAVSAVGQFEAEMSSDSFLLLGMAQRGFLPARLAARSRHGTPGLAIALSSAGILLLVPLSFLEIVDLLNAVYCLAQLLEFAAFIALRVRAPRLARPFRVPLSTAGCVLMLAPACALLVTVLVLPFVERDYKVLPWTAGVVVAGVVLQAGLALARARGWCAFVGDGPHDFRELLVTDTPTAAGAGGGGGGGVRPASHPFDDDGPLVTPSPAPEVITEDGTGPFDGGLVVAEEVVGDGDAEEGGAWRPASSGGTRRVSRLGGGGGG
jgi:amino acid transporter